MSNKNLVPCKFRSRCNKGDDCEFAHPEREANSSPFPPLPKCSTRRPQSHSRRPDFATTPNSTANRRARSNSRNSRPNSKVRHSNPIESIDHLPLTLEQIKQKIKDLYEVCTVTFKLLSDIYEYSILGRHT
jgi:hypothetical protein